MTDLRLCPICKVPRPTGDFIRSSQSCKSCRAAIATSEALMRTKRRCAACRATFDLAAFIENSTVCARCESLAKNAVAAVREAQRHWDEVLGDCRTKPLATAIPDVKFCNKCKTTKPVSSFYKDRTRLDGFESYCKECGRATKLAYYKEKATADPEYYRAYAREYKRAKKVGIPITEAPQVLRMKPAEIVEAINTGTLKTRCVRGRRVVFRVEESEE